VVFTVDSLQTSSDDAFHPAQKAIVNEHGSQCGFWTSNFVMSLFAIQKQKKNILDWISVKNSKLIDKLSPIL